MANYYYIYIYFRDAGAWRKNNNFLATSLYLRCLYLAYIFCADFSSRECAGWDPSHACVSCALSAYYWAAIDSDLARNKADSEAFFWCAVIMALLKKLLSAVHAVARARSQHTEASFIMANKICWCVSFLRVGQTLNKGTHTVKRSLPLLPLAHHKFFCVRPLCGCSEREIQNPTSQINNINRCTYSDHQNRKFSLFYENCWSFYESLTRHMICKWELLKILNLFTLSCI